MAIYMDKKRMSDLNSHLPLTESTYTILLSLAAGPRHGYAIMQDVAALSDGRIELGTGTLYGALRRLLDQGWIDRVDENVVDGRKRKAYILTPLGTNILDAETDRLRQLLAAAGKRLAGGLTG